MLDTTPAPSDDPRSIADLSQIDVLPATPGGPVRRRKTSLRSSPMAATSPELALEPRRPSPDGKEIAAALADDRIAAVPLTPLPVSLDPLHTEFRDLMPILPLTRAGLLEPTDRKHR
jgi:hypothetical protein